jgi:hypothetical protein
VDENETAGVSFVQGRMRDGDEAELPQTSKRPQNPRILGIATGEIDRREAFAFSAGATHWSILECLGTEHGPVLQ